MRQLDKYNDNYRTANYALFEEVCIASFRIESTIIDFKSNQQLPKVLKIKKTSNAPSVKSTKKSKQSAELSKSGSLPPKKPINPYLLFCQENRAAIQE